MCFQDSLQIFRSHDQIQCDKFLGWSCDVLFVVLNRCDHGIASGPHRVWENNMGIADIAADFHSAKFRTGDFIFAVCHARRKDMVLAYVLVRQREVQKVVADMAWVSSRTRKVHADCFLIGRYAVAF
ncbi:hypothetical protein D3C87_1772750 [compost metagenome]